MGMFDEVVVLDRKKRFACLDGHVDLGFQTKDFHCELDRYYIYKNRLYWRKSLDGLLAVEEIIPAIESGDSSVMPISESCSFSMYTPCRECPPLLYLVNGRICSHEPWVDFVVELVEGEIKKVTRYPDPYIDDLMLKSTEFLTVDDPRAIEWYRDWRRK